MVLLYCRVCGGYCYLCLWFCVLCYACFGVVVWVYTWVDGFVFGCCLGFECCYVGCCDCSWLSIICGLVRFFVVRVLCYVGMVVILVYCWLIA